MLNVSYFLAPILFLTLHFHAICKCLNRFIVEGSMIFEEFFMIVREEREDFWISIMKGRIRIKRRLKISFLRG